jgi:hypothetical protein
MREGMKSFLEEGVQQYVDAKKTIETFEGEMGQLLKEAVQGRKQWPPLKKKPRIGRPTPGGRGGKYGYWIWISITGQSTTYKKVDIECGLWWDVPSADAQVIDGPIIYASYCLPKDLVRFSWKRQGQDIRSFDEEDWRTFLYLPLGKPHDIEGAVGRLLDALFKQLK